MVPEKWAAYRSVAGEILHHLYPRNYSTLGILGGVRSVPCIVGTDIHTP